MPTEPSVENTMALIDQMDELFPEPWPEIVHPTDPHDKEKPMFIPPKPTDKEELMEFVAAAAHTLATRGPELLKIATDDDIAEVNRMAGGRGTFAFASVWSEVVAHDHIRKQVIIYDTDEPDAA